MAPLITVENVPVADTGNVLRVFTMNRTRARNAMNTALLTELNETVVVAIEEDAVVGIVFDGADGHFSAGADIKEELDHDGKVRRIELFNQLYETVTVCPKPTIAAVSGACVGGGAELAAACDIRVAHPSGMFRFPGAALGFPVGAAKLAGLLGVGTAKDLVLTSRTIDAVEAHRIGLVQRIDENPRGKAIEVAAEIAGNNPDTVRYLKGMFDRFVGLSDRVAAEGDAQTAVVRAGGDYGTVTQPNPKRTSGWSAVAWKHR